MTYNKTANMGKLNMIWFSYASAVIDKLVILKMIPLVWFVEKWNNND